MDVPARPRKSDYLYTNFLPNFPPISIPFSKEKHPIWIKLGAFYKKFAQNTPNLCNLGSFVSDENPPIAIPNFAKKRPKRQAHILYHVNVRTPRVLPCHFRSFHYQNHCSRQTTHFARLHHILLFSMFSPQIRDPKTCTILIPAWGSNWGYSGFTIIKITVICQVRMSLASNVV